MVRSKILLDLVNDSNSLESVLFRLKIILSDLNNEEINQWLDYEIHGYPDSEVVPDYRIITGLPKGTYILGSQYNGIQHTNANIPINHVPNDIKDNLLNLYLRDGISGIYSLTDKDAQIGKPIPTEFCYKISRPGLMVLGMNIIYSENQLHGVLANIKTKLINILLKLEKSFGNLDSLDVLNSTVAASEKQTIEQYILNIIFDNSIDIGDHNTIKSSDIGHRGEINVN